MPVHECQLIMCVFTGYASSQMSNYSVHKCSGSFLSFALRSKATD